MAKKTVLIVDDSLTVRQQLSLVLTSAGYQLIEARDGSEGMDAVRAHKEISVILCDLNMPRMNGFQVLYWLRRQWTTCKVPVIFLTASHEKSDILHGVELGAASYIVKPFDTNDLVARLEQVIAARKA